MLANGDAFMVGRRGGEEVTGVFESKSNFQ